MLCAVIIQCDSQNQPSELPSVLKVILRVVDEGYILPSEWWPLRTHYACQTAGARHYFLIIEL